MRRSPLGQFVGTTHAQGAVRLLLAAAICVATSAVVRAQPSLHQELRSALAARPHADASVSALVVDLATGQPAFAENADQPLIPASALKVFTMSVALAELGPDFTFETRFATDGHNVYVIGSGDPAFGDERLYRKRGETIAADFERWAAALLEYGIASVPGDLVIDESIFDYEWIHPTWEENDLDNWYAARVGGLNFNDNCVDITLDPSTTAGAPPLVTIQPDTSLVKIVNKCRSGGKGEPILHHAHDTFEYKINGHCRKRWQFGSVSFPDPGLLFADSLRTALAKKGVIINGTIRRERQRLPDGTIPETLTVVGRRSTPLTDVLRRAGKNSQNLFAECLLKRSGYEWAKRRGTADPQGSWKLGREAIEHLARRAGINAQGLVIADGSGLSRENACSARQLVGLLTWVQQQPFAPLLFENLSNGGVDGSLRKRLKDMPDRVFAKTGTMRGVRSLAGYANSATGPRFAFAVIFNGYNGPSTPYKQIQDRFCRALVAAADRP